MSVEWTIVTVIIALVGLISTVTVPLLKFNSSVVKLTARFDDMVESDKQKDKRNKEIHDNLSDEIADIREVSRDLEKRIIVIEVKLKGGNHNDGAPKQTTHS